METVDNVEAVDALKDARAFFKALVSNFKAVSFFMSVVGEREARETAPTETDYSCLSIRVCFKIARLIDFK